LPPIYTFSAFIEPFSVPYFDDLIHRSSTHCRLVCLLWSNWEAMHWHHILF